MEEHHELDQVLKRRFVPQAPDHLAERIIDMARMAPATQQAKAAISWFKGFWDNFALPQPVLAMAIALIIGLGIGFTGDTQKDNRSMEYDFMTQAQVQADLGDIL